MHAHQQQVSDAAARARPTARRLRTSDSPTELNPWLGNLVLSRHPLAALIVIAFVSNALQAASPSFEHDVMAVISRAGCNLGTCHGNLNGKGGLFLSLRGQDPWQDYLAMTHELEGRRINRLEPEQSLILLKPSAEVPHQGGQRFRADAPEFRILRDWIAAGAPGPNEKAPRVTRLLVTPEREILPAESSPVQIHVQAFYSDQTSRDVTQLATYEATNYVATVDNEGRVLRQTDGETTLIVRYLDHQAVVQLAYLPCDSPATAVPSAEFSEPVSSNPIRANGQIDRWILAKLQELRVPQRPLAPDHIFLRRVYFDTLGRLPTSKEAREFVADTDPDKRQRLIDQLLARPEYADQWALRWSDLLRNEEKLLDPRGVEIFHKWIRASFAEAMPLDEFVSQIILAQGSTYENPAANFYRSVRDPLSRGETVARLLFGTRLECAKCHNHPFDHWTQNDYYDWATVFGRIDYEIVENNRKDKFDQHEFIGEQKVLWKPEGEVTNARTGKPAVPRFLGRAEPIEDSGEQRPRLQQLADWMKDRDNREFARAQANRLWYHCMGRGLVEPIDDFRLTNPVSHPELLEHLTQLLIKSNYDVRVVLRSIMQSAAYQADWPDAVPHSPSAVFGADNYAGVAPRRLTAEQLIDAQCQVLDVPAVFNGYSAGTRANQIAGVERVRGREQAASDDDRFLTVFGKPQRLLSCECERSSSTTLSQAFYLLNGKALQERLTARDSRLHQWQSQKFQPKEIVENLFWTALSRSPSEAELTSCVAVLEQTDSLDRGLQDLTWAILNTKEFLFRP